jgi:oxygen-independent coproporphyrinogen-3 oxidase
LNLTYKNNLGLYIHWPYCESKCPYCDFNSHTTESINEEDWIHAYVNQLHAMKEMLIKYNVKFNKLNTIFFGGGTPSLMPLKIIDKILNTANKLFNFEENIEITLEANPGSSEREKFLDIKQIGVNRLSLGIQSLNDTNLNFLGRKHNYKDAIIALELGKKTFSNVSIDLIYGLKNQKITEWEIELSNVIKNFKPNHISVYQLTIEEGTKFYSDYKKGLLKVIDDDLSADFYDNTNFLLENFDYKRYEVSNHAKNNFECNHNLNYWNSDNWIGIGPGAYSRLWSSNDDNKRFEIENYKSPKSWLSKNTHEVGFKKINFIDNSETNIDILIMGLRLSKGIKISKLLDKKIIKNEKIINLINEKIIIINKETIKVNKNYMIKLNAILQQIIN